MWGRSSTHTFKSYLPTKWSADTDRAMERSSETAVAMTAAMVCVKVLKLKQRTSGMDAKEQARLTGFDVQFEGPDALPYNSLD